MMAVEIHATIEVLRVFSEASRFGRSRPLRKTDFGEK